MSITITSKRAGFRRCGMAHPAQPVTYNDDKFTGEELKALKAEPMLVVVEDDEPKVEAEVKPKPETKPKSDAKPKSETKPKAEAKPEAVPEPKPETPKAKE